MLVLGTNIAVLLDCSKSSRQCSLSYLLTYLHGVERSAPDRSGQPRAATPQGLTALGFITLMCAFRLTYFRIAHSVSNLMLMRYTVHPHASVTDRFSPSSRPLSATIFMVTLGRVGQRIVRCNSLRARQEASSVTSHVGSCLPGTVNREGI